MVLLKSNADDSQQKKTPISEEKLRNQLCGALSFLFQLTDVIASRKDGLNDQLKLCIVTICNL